MHKMQI